MAILRFTTTRLSGLRAAGRLNELQHSTIAPFLERELGPRYGRLFAEFEPEGSDQRAWYTDADRVPIRVADLPPTRQEAMRRATATLVDDIVRFAERMAGESTQKANLARILLAATTFPEEDIWCAGDQPVIVNWGFHRHAVPEGPPRAILDLIQLPEATPARPPAAPPPGDGPATAAAAAAPTTPSPGGGAEAAPAPVLAPPRRPARALGWLGASLLWLLFVALLLGTYRQLLPACGIGWPGLPGSRPLLSCTGQSALADAAAEGAELQGLVRQAEIQAAEQRQICAVSVPPPRPAASAAPAPPPDRSARIDDQIGTRLPPGAPRGKVEISLLWDSRVDLDLIVKCPGGEQLSRTSPQRRACGGQLMDDMNVGSSASDHAIEHAAWDAPPPGTYAVVVELYSYNGTDETKDVPFTIRIRRGTEDKIVEGHVKGVHTLVTPTTVTF